MTPVAVVGLGPMGQALAAAFLTAGHPTTVWNRTPGKAKSLTAAGAEEAPTIEKAIAAGTVIVTCLRNYEAVSATLPQEGWQDRVLINLTSGQPQQARDMASWDVPYVDGAILTPTRTIGTPAATVLYSGDAALYESARQTLTALGGTAVHLGEDVGRANAYEVALLDLFATAVHGVTHAFALAAAEGIPAPALAPFATGIGTMLPDMITRFADRIAAGEHPGDQSTIASAGSAITHIIATATSHGLDTGALTATQAVINKAIANGHGDAGLSYLTTALQSS